MNYTNIKYGTNDISIDISDIIINTCIINNILYIPKGDNERNNLFSDPIIGQHKFIFFNNNIYDENTELFIDITTNTIIEECSLFKNHSKLIKLQKSLKLNHGSFYEEFPEQLMAINFLKGDEKVLEIGGNIGRNSIIISNIIPSTNLVVLETDPDISKQLFENRNINELNFNIENLALSNRKLVQIFWNTLLYDELIINGKVNVDLLSKIYNNYNINKNWNDMSQEELHSHYKIINTISLIDLKQIYNITFDTLIIDCEGAFYYILMDMPEILDNINLIIMENDYDSLEKKNYVDNQLKNEGFIIAYSQILQIRPGVKIPICKDNFFEVWIRKKPSLHIRKITLSKYENDRFH